MSGSFFINFRITTLSLNKNSAFKALDENFSAENREVFFGHNADMD